MKKLQILLGEYMMANPQAENPMSFLEVFGIDGLIEILEKAKNRLVTFETGDDLTDVITPLIDGRKFV